MTRIMLGAVLFAILSTTFTNAQSPKPTDNEEMASVPSAEEINDLLNKATEYITTYRTMFKDAKPTLDKAPLSGFNEKAEQLASQASTIIAAIEKNGRSAYALVTLIAVLDDMSLNAQRASSMAMIVGLKEPAGEPQRRATQDLQDLAQAGKNCYDISELILHSTLRLISVEEKVLSSLANQK